MHVCRLDEPNFESIDQSGAVCCSYSSKIMNANRDKSWGPTWKCAKLSACRFTTDTRAFCKHDGKGEGDGTWIFTIDVAMIAFVPYTRRKSCIAQNSTSSMLLSSLRKRLIVCWLCWQWANLAFNEITFHFEVPTYTGQCREGIRSLLWVPSIRQHNKGASIVHRRRISPTSMQSCPLHSCWSKTACHTLHHPAERFWRV